MKPPQRLQALIEEGLIDTVVRQLMSGKEAMATQFVRPKAAISQKFH